MKKPLAIGCGLIVVAVLALLGWGFYELRDAIKTDPTEVRALQQEILPVTVPAHLEPEGGASMFGARLAVFRGASEREALVLASFPAEAMEEGEAQWRSETQVDWGEVQVTERQTSQAAFDFQGATLQAEQEDVVTDGGSFRSFLVQIPSGAGHTTVLFRVGPAEEVTREHVQALLDEAAARLGGSAPGN